MSAQFRCVQTSALLIPEHSTPHTAGSALELFSALLLITSRQEVESLPPLPLEPKRVPRQLISVILASSAATEDKDVAAEVAEAAAAAGTAIKVLIL